MELSQAIGTVAELTDRVLALLDTGNFEDVPTLLDEREMAMEAFEDIHYHATAIQRHECQVLLLDLQMKDRRLVEISEKLLEAVSAEFRDQFGLPSTGQKKSAGDPLPGCVDRKA